MKLIENSLYTGRGVQVDMAMNTIAENKLHSSCRALEERVAALNAYPPACFTVMPEVLKERHSQILRVSNLLDTALKEFESHIKSSQASGAIFSIENAYELFQKKLDRATEVLTTSFKYKFSIDDEKQVKQLLPVVERVSAAAFRAH